MNLRMQRLFVFFCGIVSGGWNHTFGYSLRKDMKPFLFAKKLEDLYVFCHPTSKRNVLVNPSIACMPCMVWGFEKKCRNFPVHSGKGGDKSFSTKH